MHGVVEECSELIRAPAEGGTKVGAADVADEQRVARQHRVGVGLVGGVVDDERDRLRRVTRSLERLECHARAQLQHVTIRQGLERKLRLSARAEADRRADLITQLEMSRDEIGMEVGQDRVANLEPLLLRIGDVLVDVTLRVNDRSDPASLVRHEVGGVSQAAEVVLREYHDLIVGRAAGPPGV